jgi:hypothetical protein
MKYFLVLFTFAFHHFSFSQCTTTNATSCVCENGTSTCWLLPDITASWKGISNNGYIEYPQNGAGINYPGQGPDDGRIRVSGSTPNIGHGSFTVRGVNENGLRTFLCGNDTVFNAPSSGQFTCPNGYANPKQLITQRVYKKNSDTMSYFDRWAGSVTYHPAHGHNHVDDWAVMTLRIQTADPNPLNWPIVGTGAKIGFCLMDYGQCGNTGSTYDGHCRDDNTVYLGGNTLHNSNFPNFNLGGGNYNCSTTEQGISSGWTDVYGKHLDGMWINVPPNTCNGNYYIVLEIDKNNLFLEEREDNNYTAVPVTLSLQHPTGSLQIPTISSDNSTNLCTGQSLNLTATAGSSFLWSNGDTTQTINVTSPGSYTCTVTNYCGTSTSSPFIVYSAAPIAPVGQGDTVCVSGSMILTASGTGNLSWYDSNGLYVGTGNTYTTPILTQTTEYFAQNTDVYSDTLFQEPHSNGIGGGGWLSSEQYEIFSTSTSVTLKSVKVYAQNAGNITIELQDESGTLLESNTTAVPAGESRVQLNFSVPYGDSMRLVGKNLGVNLYRNNNSATYPYNPNDKLTIIGASAGASYFYYFYDWEVVSANSTCSSAMTSVFAVVSSCLNIAENVLFKKSIKLFPNPNNGSFDLEFETIDEGNLSINMTNLLGQIVFEDQVHHSVGKNTISINQNKLAKGVYLMNMVYEGKNYISRMIVE